MDHSTKNQTPIGAQSSIKMEKKFRCETCVKSYTTAGNLKRQRAYHTPEVTRYYCCHCHKQYARKENTRKHSIMEHRDHEKPVMVIRTANKRYFSNPCHGPRPWRQDREIIQINLRPSAAMKNEKTKQPQLSPADTYIGLTIEQALDVIARTLQITTEELLENLYQSSSDSSISSYTTELLDKRDNFSKEDITGIKVYGIFQTERSNK